jgi:prepilin peptidase CpaA
MNPDVLLLLGALAIAIVAAIVDVQQHRIPNWLTYPAMLGALLLRSFFFGWRGAGAALLGCVLAGGIVLLFSRLRAIGAGDLKLLAALGALVGAHDALVMLLATAIAGGVLAMLYAACRAQLRATLVNLRTVLKFHAWCGLQVHPEINLDNPAALRMPYGLAIVAGVLYTLVTTGWR